MGRIFFYGILTTAFALVCGFSSLDQDEMKMFKTQKCPFAGILSTTEENGSDDSLSKVDCKCNSSAKYRTFDGSCNNLENPKWGIANSPVVRLFPASYADGKSKIRLSKNGSPLPNVRHVRSTLLLDGESPDPDLTLGVMSWGQMVAHDVAFRTISPEAPKSCCNPDGSFNPDPNCLPISIPPNDYFYSKFNQLCMDVKRVRTANNSACITKPAQQISGVTHYMDGSFIYGLNKNASDTLRQFKGGLLKTRSAEDGRPFLINAKQPTKVCDVSSDSDVCYLSGDPERVNLNTEIAATQVMFLRLHNILATDLQRMHPTWSDEIIYQETRRIVIAIVQHITYNEYVPLLLGPKYVESHHLAPLKSGYAKGYNSSINPSSLSEFVSAAFRSFHSSIVGSPQLFSENRLVRNSIQLSDHTNKPGIIQDSNNFDYFLRGLITQPQSEQDSHFTDQITNKFTGNKTKPLAERNGTDLISMDINRGREYGVPPYSEMRRFCGLPPINKFEDLKDGMNTDKISLLSKVYSDIHDVDYYVGAVLEHKLPGTLTSPSFHCVIAEAFYRYKFSDRFFYEFDGHPGKFTPAQLDSIRNFTYSTLICMTSDHIKSAQLSGFRRLNPASNSLIRCSEITKTFKLDPWA
ncbi:peroxidase-like isoform X1 [Planococcus citri]|uniref:peroxidase-like isoform X1 n=1 Tax=Planococcus citri TaxID=170843 RepID=UPI0031F8D8F0